MERAKQFEAISAIVDSAQRIVVLQADNPDADSLGSALALEDLLGELGKDVWLYSSVDVPQYLRYLAGWDRVTNSLPSSFDAAIIVDASTMTLFDIFNDSMQRGILASKPLIVLDHHAITDNPISFASVSVVDPSVSSAGELVYELANSLGWAQTEQSRQYIATAILGDTQGLTNELAGPGTYRVLADMIEGGLDRPRLEELRREFGKMPEPILRYKATLIDRTELYGDNALAIVVVPQDEINRYSPLYNPAPLIQNDLLQTQGIKLAIVLKHYDSGRITASIRANSEAPIAGALAEKFGGGGHKYASGFKIENGRPFNEVKSECIRLALELLQTAN